MAQMLNALVAFEPSSLGIIHMDFTVWPGVSTGPGTFVERRKEGRKGTITRRSLVLAFWFQFSESKGPR